MQQSEKKSEPEKPVGPAIYRAINAVQAGLAKEGIAKDRKNDQQGYKFRGIDDIYNALSSLLGEHGLCILPRVLSREVTERTNKNGTVLFYVVVDVEFDFVAAADSSKHTVKVCGEAMDSGDKATNKAMSAAYKYACLQTFCIPTEGDNDADATTHQIVPATPKALSTPARVAAKPIFEQFGMEKIEGRIAVGTLSSGEPDYDGFMAELESALQSARSVSEATSLKKANAGTLNALKAERPDLFEHAKTLFTQISNALA